jgi:hypothetical protein
MDLAMRSVNTSAFVVGLIVTAACGSRTSSSDAAAITPEPTLRASIQPVTSVEQAKAGVFIPPFKYCRAPKPGDTGASANGEVCTQVGISGCTEPGKYFADYAACDVVRTQRPYWPRKPANVPRGDDPRVNDESFMSELAWVTEQARATACTCCHDSKQAPSGPSQWYIDAEPIWTDTVSDSGIALFAGLADSSVFGAFDPKDNNGFQRTETGLPSTDARRMKAFFVAELARRGITEEQGKAYPPFGGALFALSRRKPEACTKGEGVDADGIVRWEPGATARYVYILDAGAANPGAPPNLDIPAGTRWRLDVLASADAIHDGIRYGTTPEGSFQAFPGTGRAPQLDNGSQYHLFVLKDIGVPATNCLFRYAGP